MTKKTNPDLDTYTKISLSFEEAITELDSIVNRMESGQLPLEDSLQAFKRGSTLLQLCQKTLADVEQQILILNESGQLKPYEAKDD